jgi:hypothetical protein
LSPSTHQVRSMCWLVWHIAHDKCSSTVPVLLIEVGLQNEDWWKKIVYGWRDPGVGWLSERDW